MNALYKDILCKLINAVIKNDTIEFSLLLKRNKSFEFFHFLTR